MAGRRPRVQRGPGARHPAAGHLAVGPAADDPRPAPQRRRRHRGGGLPLPGRPVPAGLVTRRGSRRAGGGSRSGPRCAASSSRPPRAGSASTSRSPSRSPTGCRTPSTGCSPRRWARGPSASCRPRSWRSAGWRPGCRRRSPRCTRLNRLVHEVIDEAFSPAVIDVGTTTALDVAWWIRQRFARPRRRAVVPAERRRCSGPACRCRERGACCPAVAVRRRDRAGRPGALRRRARAAWACAPTPSATATCCGPARTTPRPGCGAALRAGQPDAGPDHRRRCTVGRTGNEVLAAARAAAAAEGIDARRLLPPGRRPRPRRGPGDRPVGPAGRRPRGRRLPGPPRHRLRPGAARCAGRCRSGAASACGWPSSRASPLTADGVEYLDGRQTELILIPSG